MKRLLYIISIIIVLFGLITCKSLRKVTQKQVVLESVYNDQNIDLDGVIHHVDEEPLSDYGSTTPIKVGVSPKLGSGISTNVNSSNTTNSSHNTSYSQLNEDLVNDNIGELVYSIPDTMAIFKEYKIVVRISKKLGTVEIREDIDNYVERNIRISSKMEVMLIDSSPDSAFNIKKINKNTQIIDDIDYTEWIFIVKPLKPGKRSLNLVISIVTGDNIKQKVYTDSVQVQNNIAKQVKGFWEIHWKWLFTTLIIPIFVYFWKKRNKKND